MKFTAITGLVSVLFITLTTGLSAQRITLTGKVTDSLQNPLDLANVVAINQSDQSLDGFGITSPEGIYKVNLKTGTNYVIKFSYIGFRTREIKLTTEEKDIVMDVILSESAEQLDEVEVVQDIPISIQGDTIVYNTDSFVSGTEKKLADVLEKLPGVEVNEDGEIEVEGKRVTKVMVEGKDFFDGDSKIASKNIPANALDKIEVLRNYSEVNQLRGVTNNQDNVALNIRLKEGKKKFWFGELTAGAGLDDRYLVHPKLFYYSPKYSVNILTDLNNIGELPFTTRDYWNFTGGFRGATNPNNGTNFNTGGGGLGLALLQNNRAKEIIAKFGAVNFSYSPSNSWTLTGFGIYSYSNTLLETVATRSFISSGQTEQTSTAADQRSHLGLVKLNSSFKPSDSFQWEYDALLRLSDENEQTGTLSVADVTDQIEETQSQRPVRVTQNSNLYFTPDPKHIFALEVQSDYGDEDPFYRAVREQQPFVGTIPFDTGQEVFDIDQEQRVQTYRLDAKLDYFWVTGPRSNINLTLGTTQSTQDFDSRIFQILDSGEILDFDQEELGNEVEFDFSDVYAGLHYKLVTGQFTINPGLFVHRYRATNEQLGTSVSDELTNVVPDVFINWQWKQSESLRLNYRVSRNFSDINQFASGLIFNNYNALFQGNRDLESALFHNVSLNFFSFNLYNQQNIFANASYSRRIDAFKSSTLINGINQVNTPINSNLVDETLNGTGSFQRTFGRIKVTTRASLNWSNTFNIVNDLPQNSRSLSQNYTASVGSSFRKAPNLELGMRYTINTYENGDIESTFYTERPFARFDAAFLGGFIFLADYEYYRYSDKADTIENQFGFLNASLSYQKKDSHWEFSLNGTNLTNNTDLNQDSFNDLFFVTSQYQVQPRFVYLQLKYEL